MPEAIKTGNRDHDQMQARLQNDFDKMQAQGVAAIQQAQQVATGSVGKVGGGGEAAASEGAKKAAPGAE